MNRKLIIAAALATGLLSSNAQINSPGADGYLLRGKQMYNDANYNGCIDQMLQVRQLYTSPSQLEEAFYYSAMATVGLGDDEAVPMLLGYLDMFPTSPRRQEVLKTVADVYFSAADYPEAIRRYLKVDVNALDNAAAADYLYRLAYSYLMMAEYDKALTGFDRLLTDRQYASAARFYQGYIAYCRGEYDKALAIFNNADTSTEPGNTVPYYLAQIYFSKGDYAKSLAAAKRSIASNIVPTLTVESRRIAGESLFHQGNIHDAIPYLWEYAAESPSPQPSAFYILGISEFDNGDYQAAAKLLQQAVTADNAMAQNAYLYLGQCYLKMGNNNNAAMAFENAYRMNYDPQVRETALYNYAVALSEGGKAPFSSAVSVMEDFMSQYPDSRYTPMVTEYLVNGYIADDDYEHALASINRLSNPGPDILKAKQRVLFVLGTRQYAEGNTSLALARFNEARDIANGNAPISAQATLWSADCLYAMGEYPQAAARYIEFLDRVPAADPNRRIALYNLGYTRYQQHEYNLALTNFTRACDAAGDISPQALADIHNRMGDCYYNLHDFKAAATQFRQAFDLNPSTGDYALYQQAVMEGINGDHTRQLQLLDSMTDRFPTSPLIPAALLAKAETYTAMGNRSGAIATYNRLVRDYPSSAYGRNGMLQLAVTHLNNGDRQAAIDTYRKVIYSYPTSDEARLAADDLKRIYAQDGNLAEYAAFINSIPSAPALEPGEMDNLSFEVAEDEYLAGEGTDKLKSYIKEYPHGASVATALYYLAEDAEDTGRYDEALNYAATIIMAYPHSDVAEEALAIKAGCELRQGKAEIALATYRELEERSSDPAMLYDTRMAIMRVSRDLNRHADVVTTADKLLGSSAVNSADLNEIHFTRALALDRLKRHDEAEREWATLAALPTDIYGAKSAYYMAQSQFERGNTSKAEKTVTTLLASDTPHAYWRARGVILLSDILRKKGENFEADEYLRAIRNNYKGNDPDIFQMVDSRLK